MNREELFAMFAAAALPALIEKREREVEDNEYMEDVEDMASSAYYIAEKMADEHYKCFPEIEE